MILYFFIYENSEGYLNFSQHGYDKVWTARAAFDSGTLNDIKREYANNLDKLKPEQNSFVLSNRKQFIPATTSVVTRALQDKTFISRLEKIIGSPHKLVLNTTTLPPAYREYGIDSEMRWHRDTSLTNVPQYEVVITLSNNSDSQFLWKHEKQELINRAETSANNLVIVRAGGIKHAVSPVTRGKRVIIKAAYDVKK